MDIIVSCRQSVTFDQEYFLEGGSPPYFTIAAMRSGLPEPPWIFIGKATM